MKTKEFNEKNSRYINDDTKYSPKNFFHSIYYNKKLPKIHFEKIYLTIDDSNDLDILEKKYL